jgi:hypothetical protein
MAYEHEKGKGKDIGSAVATVVLNGFDMRIEKRIEKNYF